MDKKIEQYNILYKVLKKLDNEILKHYNRNEISDNDYFFDGINSDIFSNTLNILTNYLSGNIESAGVDLSCRAIIEAMVILKMHENGAITENQKRIYRYLYAYVDIDNFHSIIHDIETTPFDKSIKRLESDKEKAKQAMLAHFRCTENDLKNRKISIDDPCFYLKTKLNDDIRFVKLLEKYPLGDGNEIKFYEFFSLFIHPRCETNYKFEVGLMELRRKHYVEEVLNYVINYLKQNNLFEYDKNSLDFNDDFFYNPQFITNVKLVKDVEKLIHLTKNQICNLPSGYDAFIWQFLEKVRYLIIDMIISLTFGYNEHVIACFKPFIEEYSIFYAINLVESEKDFEYLKKGYLISSRIQLSNHFQKLGQTDLFISETEIKDLYENYYKDKYKMDDYDSFHAELTKNSLFFLSKERKSFNKHVRTLIESIFDDDIDESKDIMTLYRISKDMCHASGYNFNATTGMVNIAAHKTLFYTYKLINYFVINVFKSLKEKGIKNEENNIVSFLETMMNFHKAEVKRISNEQIENALKWKNQKN